ncbi:hypothetical protein OG203_30300 [Nocardia sp. NBC_01499]|uniref:hypothetical protein n=1 Tax=Nocardia sp. NBC_01499 TaxID=2903597 RepID=UPI00386F16BF
MNRVEDRWAISELMTAWNHGTRSELAHLLETAGPPVTGNYPTRCSKRATAILEAGSAWLAESNVA